MAVKTMSISKSTGLYDQGWHEVTVRKAAQGTWNGPKGDKIWIDLWFENYADNQNLRVFEVVNKETNEEFKISNLFRHAMAGIIEKLDDPTGKKPILQYDDDVENLVGTHLNAYIYKNKDGYNEFFDTVAPIEQEGKHYSFNKDQVTALKNSAEKNFFKSNKSNHLTNSVTQNVTPIPNTTSNEDIPF